MRPIVSRLLVIFWLFFPLIEGLHYLFTIHTPCPDCSEILHNFERKGQPFFANIGKRSSLFPLTKLPSHRDICVLAHSFNKQEFDQNKNFESIKFFYFYNSKLRGDINLYRGEILDVAPKNSPPSVQG